MTRSIPATFVLSALLSTALAGCGSGNAEPAPGTTARDASPMQDGIGAPDAAPAPVAPADAAPAPVAVADAGSSASIGTAMSSLQRIADPQVPVSDTTTLAADNAAFAFAAYKLLIATNTNLVFSPASISIALAMTYAGAAGTTATEMAGALHFTLPPVQLHPAFNVLDQALASRGQGKLGADGGPMRMNIVNALWAEQTYTFKSDFLDTLAANYGAGVNLLDFLHSPDPSRLAINAWVAAQTADKIQDLLPQGSVSSATALVLTNAVYFNAAWKTPFDANKTYDGPFTLLDGSTVTVKFMDGDGSYLPAMQGTNFVAASLPYADDNLSLVVVLPDAGHFSQVESSLDATALVTLAAGMTTQRVGLFLPRFKLQTGLSLADTLKNLGMTSAFEGGTADFSGMDGAHDLCIGDVIHKAFIDVAEKGTEAAAATGVVMVSASIPTPPPPELLIVANRPFLYFLRDQPTGAILFMGRVLDPSQN